MRNFVFAAVLCVLVLGVCSCVDKDAQNTDTPPAKPAGDTYDAAIGDIPGGDKPETVKSIDDTPLVYKGNRTALFDGKTLGGWDVLNCKATVDNGDILIVEGNGLVQTEKKYGNFILEFDWKPLAEQKWDSGIYFRYDSVPEGQPWPKKYQINLKQNYEGNCDEIRKAKSKGLFKPGTWNRFKLTVNGKDASVEINGQPAWNSTGVGEPAKGYIAIQAEVPQGGKHRFRNIYITELD